MDDRLRYGVIGGLLVVVGAVVGLLTSLPAASLVTAVFVVSLIGAMFVVAAGGPDVRTMPGEAGIDDGPAGPLVSIPFADELLYVLLGSSVVSGIGLLSVILVT